MKLNDSDIKKIERLADCWEVRMPDERFFVNLPAKVLHQAAKAPSPWWARLTVPAGAVATIVLLLAFGFFGTLSEIRGTNSLTLAAVQLASESVDWEGIDLVLAEAKDAGISGLHHYLDPSGLESAAAVIDLEDHYTQASGL